MAEEELELAEPKGSHKGLIIIIGVLATLLVLGGTVAALYFTGVIGPGASTEGGGAAAGSAAVAQPAEPEPPKEAIYAALDPAFTVNLQGKSRARYLQIALEALIRDAKVEDDLRKLAPVIRNDLVLLFSSKASQDLATREGKDKLRQETLEAIQKVLQRETGRKGVEQVYFTAFVMQ